MYQRVQKVECSSHRPVLILGPLAEACKDMMVKEAPNKFCRCLPGELVHTLQSVSLVYFVAKDTFMSLIFENFHLRST